MTNVLFPLLIAINIILI